MDFYDVLDHVVTLLQRRGRVTYNALKLQFHLDDEQLAILKDELLYAHPQVVDDTGRGLRWTDDTAATQAHTPLAPQHEPQPVGLTGLVGHGIPDAAGFYETAWARYGDPEFAWVLEQNYAARPREGLEVLLDGAEKIEGASAPRRASVQLADSGLAVLRAGAGADENCLILKAGPDGGGHGHPSTLGPPTAGPSRRPHPAAPRQASAYVDGARSSA